MSESTISAAYLVSGMPQILLANETSEGYQKLYDAYGEVRKEIEESDAEVICYYSTGWLSILGYMLQADPNPTWTHVDQNWHELGSMEYKFSIDTDLAKAYAEQIREFGFQAKEINYHGFPIDTGTVVAQKLLNPNNTKKAVMVSSNMYAEKVENTVIGQACTHALQKQGKKAIAVIVSNLSNRLHTKKTPEAPHTISCQKDDEWNHKILELLAQGDVEDVAQCAREFAKQGNADGKFKSIWWLNGLLGQHNDFDGKVFAYEPVWGCGASVVGLYPKRDILPIDIEEISGSEEGTQAEMVEELTQFHRRRPDAPGYD